MAKRRGNNEGSVFQRKSGEWTAMVTIEGKRLSKYFKTRREANDWKKKTLDQIDAGMSLAGAQVTVAEYLQDWLTTAKTTIRPKTYEQYFQVVNQHIIPILEKIKLAELRPDNIQSLYNGKLRSGTSARTVGIIHVVIHRALHIALRLGLVVRNAADAVTKPKYTKKEMKVLDDVQVRNFLLAAQGTGYEAFFQLEVTTGLRLGEMFGLKWSDLDWTTRKL
jgi:integrase